MTEKEHTQPEFSIYSGIKSGNITEWNKNDKKELFRWIQQTLDPNYQSTVLSPKYSYQDRGSRRNQEIKKVLDDAWERYKQELSDAMEELDDIKREFELVKQKYIKVCNEIIVLSSRMDAIYPRVHYDTTSPTQTEIAE